MKAPYNSLDKHAFYRPFRKLLIRECGIRQGCRLWEEAGIELDREGAECCDYRLRYDAAKK